METAKGIAISHGLLSRELTELIRETRPELLYPPCRPGHRRRGITTAAAALIGAAMFSLLLASAQALAESPGQVARLAQEHHACAVVLGLDASEAPYQDCVAALRRDLPPVDPPSAVASADSADLSTRQKANAACADIGLERESLAYGRCVVDVQQALSDEQQIYR